MIELRLLGSVDLQGAGGRTLDDALRRSKGVALLAFLAAARPQGFHRRDKVAALFWPDLDKERARGALRTTLFRLRDDLGEDVVESRGSEQIGVRSDRLWCDAAALTQCLDNNDALGAATLYRGPMLDGVHIGGTSDAFEQWLSEERTSIRERLIGSLAASADRFAAAGEWASALEAARRAASIAPDDESAARRLIRIALLAGDRGTALRAYEDIERVLGQDYDVAPSEETAALIAPLRGTARPPSAAKSAVTQDLPRGGAPEASGRNASPDAPGNAAGWLRPAAAPSGTLLRNALIAVAIVVGVAATWRVARIGMRGDVVAAAPDGTWRRFDPGAETAPARHHARIALDSSRDGLLVIGGASSAGDRQTMEPMDTELWRLSGLGASAVPQWVRVPIAPGRAPQRRWMFGAAFDPAADRWFVHGGARGWTSPCSNDTWVLDHASGIAAQPVWRAVTARGPLPPPRAAFELIFDKERRKLILFGGNDCINTYFNDTWVFAFDDATLASGTWSRLSADSADVQPVARNAYAALYDAPTARLFVYGGSNSQARATSELWVLEHADGGSGTPRWHSMTCEGDAPALVAPASAYDPGRDSWSFFGGSDEAGASRRELWRLDGLVHGSRPCRWATVAFTEPWPLARNAASAVILPGGSAFAIFGGYVEQFSVRDTWVFAESMRR